MKTAIKRDFQTQFEKAVSVAKKTGYAVLLFPTANDSCEWRQISIDEVGNNKCQPYTMGNIETLAPNGYLLIDALGRVYSAFHK